MDDHDILNQSLIHRFIYFLCFHPLLSHLSLGLPQSVPNEPMSVERYTPAPHIHIAYLKTQVISTLRETPFDSQR